MTKQFLTLHYHAIHVPQEPVLQAHDQHYIERYEHNGTRQELKEKFILLPHKFPINALINNLRHRHNLLHPQGKVLHLIFVNPRLYGPLRQNIPALR